MRSTRHWLSRLTDSSPRELPINESLLSFASAPRPRATAIASACDTKRKRRKRGMRADRRSNEVSAPYPSLGDAVLGEQQAPQVDHAAVKQRLNHETQALVSNEVVLKPDVLCHIPVNTLREPAGARAKALGAAPNVPRLRQSVERSENAIDSAIRPSSPMRFPKRRRSLSWVNMPCREHRHSPSHTRRRSARLAW